MTGNNETWYGLAKNGEHRMISHGELMAWAETADQQFQVGWSDAYIDPSGIRLVRGPRMIAAARARGWDDLANALINAGFTDRAERKDELCESDGTNPAKEDAS